MSFLNCKQLHRILYRLLIQLSIHLKFCTKKHKEPAFALILVALSPLQSIRIPDDFRFETSPILVA
jgi:hypothetical protein